MKSVTVIGCGIIGLTTAIKLQDAGFKVNMVAREPYNKTLSSKVGAIWFPFEIHPKEKANNWATFTYEKYLKEAKTKNGISFIPFMTAYDSESNNDWTLQLPEGSVRKALAEELPKGVKSALISKVPLAEPALYLPYLFSRFIKNGGDFKQQCIISLREASQLDSLVINCTGLGAKELCDDHELRPMRGQILRCEKTDIPSFADSTQKGALSYIINRSTDCVIGGTDYENDWNKKVEKSDTDLIMNRLLERELSQTPPKIIEEIVGLRPMRSAVRFEFDTNFPNVFHNYGHGGAGFTVAWGCAMEIAEVLKSN
jgi:D-amino-acid oxidase